MVDASVFAAGADGSLSTKPDAPWEPLCRRARLSVDVTVPSGDSCGNTRACKTHRGRSVWEHVRARALRAAFECADVGCAVLEYPLHSHAHGHGAVNWCAFKGVPISLAARALLDSRCQQ